MITRKFVRLILLGFAFVSGTALADSGLTYHGRIIKPNGAPVTSNSVQFRLQIRTPGTESCVLYEEIKTEDLSSTNGMFAITVGDNPAARQDAYASEWTLFEALSNRRAFNFNSADCSGGSNFYNPNPKDNRSFQVYFNDGTFAGWEELPSQIMNYIPMSIESYAVGGFPADSLLRFEEPDGTLVNTSPLNNSQYDELLKLLAGTSGLYEKPGRLNGATLPTIDSGESIRWDGAAWETYTPLASGSETDPTVQAFAQTALPICGADEVLKSDGTSFSCVTAASSVTGDDIQSGTIGGSTSISTAGNIQTTNDMTTGRLFLYDNAGNGPGFVGFQAPGTVSTSYTFTFPVDGGSNGQVLATNGSGVLTWISPSTGSLVEVIGTANEIDVDDTDAARPVLSLADLASSPAGSYGSAPQVPVITVDTKGRVTSASQRYINASDLRDAAGDPQLQLCNTNQVMRWSTLTDKFICSSIAIDATQVANLPAALWQANSGDIYRSTGNVGIGTTSPDAQLDVRGKALVRKTASSAAALFNLDDSIDNSPWVQFNTNGTSSGIGFDEGNERLSLGVENGYDISFQTGVNFGDNPAAGGTTSVFIKRDGNVGIGTTNPSTKLDIEGQIRIGGGSPGLGKVLTSSADGTATWQDLPAALWSENSGDIYRSTGNVGLGTTAPSERLDVAGKVKATEFCLGVDCIDEWPSGGGGGGGGGLLADGTVPMTGNLRLNGNWLSNDGGNEGIRISDTGRVGINTSTQPGAPLHIQMSTDGNILSGGETAMLLMNTQSPAFGINMTLQSGAAGQGSLFFGDTSSDKAGMIRYDHADDSMRFHTSSSGGPGAEHMRISKDGDVGIGTTAPGDKLHVAGKIRAAEICDEAGANCKIISSGWGSGASSLSGDVSGAFGTTTVDAIKGKTVVPVAYSAGQVLRYNGTSWVNALVDLSTDVTDTLPITRGGTGAVSQSGAINNLLPSQTGKTNKILQTDGTNVSWVDTPTTGITALTGDVTASGTGSVAATIANDAVTTAKIADGTITGLDLDFGGVNSATNSFVLQDSLTHKFTNFACATTGHVPTWTATGFVCQAPSMGLVHFTESLETAAPNATVPVVSFKPNNAAANVDMVLSPKGNGALAAQVADETVAGGSKRGKGAVDWQMERYHPTEVASGSYSAIVGGHQNTASGWASSVFGGYDNKATSESSATLGGGSNMANSMASVVVGGQANTTSKYAAVILGGEDNGADGIASVILGGRYNETSGIYSVATGYKITSGSYAQVTMGRFNLPIGSEDAQNWQATDPLFVVGNGASDAVRSNALMILKNGNVGIGVTNPGMKLDVNGDIRIANASKLYIGAVAVCDSTGCPSPSDARYKENVIPLENSLENLADSRCRLRLARQRSFQ